MTHRILTIAAMTLALSAGASSAATLHVTGQNSSSILRDANGDNNWSVRTVFAVGNSAYWTRAGVFRLRGEDDNGSISDFLAFCLQPLESMRVNIDYEMGHMLTDSALGNLQTLAANAWDQVTDSYTAAAFQMAAWEITTETNQSYDIAQGHFRIIGDKPGSNAAEGIAQTWLGNIQNNVWSAPSNDYMLLTANGTQDLVTNIQPMPIPASGLLLIGGLAGAGAIARRKQKTK